MRGSLLLLVAGLVLAGCGGGASSQSASVGGTPPACASTAGDRGLSGAYPQGFPLPDGTVIESTRDEGGFAVAQGFVAGDLDAAADFFRTELPKAGYELGEGDAEEHEAETEFEGNGIEEGRLKLHDVSGCDGALSLALAIKKGDQ